MPKKILVVSGSPKKDGNTAALVEWFTEGVRAKGGEVERVNAATLKFKSNGCLSCRACQKSTKFQCVVSDDAQAVLTRMADADVIIFATPLYFFSASAQIKILMDRMFSLFKWDNAAGTMQTVLKGKTMVLLGSAFEDVGLDVLEAPFKLTAEYSGMKFLSLVIPNAGVSGEIRNKPGVREKAVALGQRVAG